jgi:hypothetical protein
MAKVGRMTILAVAASTLVAGLALAADMSTGKSDTTKAGFEGQHTMSGTVTSIDEKTGMMHLKTAEGTLHLHFPPSQIQNIKKGEKATVELAIRPDGAPSASSEHTSGTAKK